MAYRIQLLCTILLLVFCLGKSAHALTQIEKENELRFADGLISLGLPTYAEKVLELSGLTGPEAKVIKIKTLLLTGQFEKVLKIIAAERDQESLDTWAMRLTLADAYFAWGKYTEAEAIYTKFFSKHKNGPPKEIESFFFDSAYKFAQMKLLQNDKMGAIRAYQSALKGKPPQGIRRQIQADLAELMLTAAESTTGKTREAYIKEIDQIADDLLWKQDVWFGKAIVMKAHLAFLKGDVEGAMKLMDYYKPQLRDIDEQLKLQSTKESDLTVLSPMAQVRYLLGTMLLERAKKILDDGGDRRMAEGLLKGRQTQQPGKKPVKSPGAVQHFLQVFMRFSNTPWAADAGKHFEEAKALLENEFGREVKFEATAEQWAKVENATFGAAKTAFNQHQYEDSAEKYIKALERFSSSRSAVGAISDLVACYVELDDDLYADMAVLHLAERFNKRTKESTPAGNTMLHIGAMYAERGREAKRDEVYEIFFNNFQKHPMAPQLLFSAGERRFAASDYEGAVDYYRQVTNRYAGSPITYKAMGKIAACYGHSGNAVEEIKALKALTSKLIADERLGHELIRGLYRLGSAFRKLDKKYYKVAIRRYKDVVTRLETSPDKYQRSKEDADKNQELLEASIYFKSYCLAKLPPPEGKPEYLYKKAALKGFLDLAEKYPKSKLTPQSMSQAGTLWTILGNSSEAQQIFSKLKRAFPDSPEAKNVDFQLAMSLLDLGMRRKAIEGFRDMFAAGGKYSEGQILTAGRELLKAKEYEIAVEAFTRVLSTAKDRAKIEPALAGKGRAQVGNKQFAEGAKTLEELFAKYPRTALTVVAAFDLSRAYARLAAEEPNEIERAKMFNSSVRSMKLVLKYDPARRAESSIEVGRIQELRSQSEKKYGSPEDAVAMLDEAIGTYQTIILLESPDDGAVRPFLEEAYHECTRLFLETKRWQDAFDDANAYLETFTARGKYALDIRSLRSRARAKLTITASPKPAGEATPTEEDGGESAGDSPETEEGQAQPAEAVETAAATDAETTEGE